MRRFPSRPPSTARPRWRAKADLRLLRGLRFSGLHLPLRLDPGRALHPRPRLRFLSSKLLADPTQLEVLGNGKQRKSYLYVQDCIDAILTRDRDGRRRHASTSSTWARTNIARSTSRRLDLRSAGAEAGTANRRRAGLDRRQPVHLPRLRPDPRLGWKPKLSIQQGRLIKTLDYLHANPWVWSARHEGLCYGLWHLGTVTAACLASRGITTVGLAGRHRRRRLSSIREGAIVRARPGRFDGARAAGWHAQLHQ